MGEFVDFLAGLLIERRRLQHVVQLSNQFPRQRSEIVDDVEIGFNQISEVLAQPTVELVGPLPSAIQNYTQFAPGIVTGSNQTDAARMLVIFLTSPAAQTVLKAKGFE